MSSSGTGEAQDDHDRPDNQLLANAVCSFCGKPRREVGPMVEGPNDVYMCEACVFAAVDIVRREQAQRIAALQTRVEALEDQARGET